MRPACSQEGLDPGLGGKWASVQGPGGKRGA